MPQKSVSYSYTPVCVDRRPCVRDRQAQPAQHTALGAPPLHLLPTAPNPVHHAFEQHVKSSGHTSLVSRSRSVGSVSSGAHDSPASCTRANVCCSTVLVLHCTPWFSIEKHWMMEKGTGSPQNNSSSPQTGQDRMLAAQSASILRPLQGPRPPSDGRGLHALVHLNAQQIHIHQMFRVH